MHYLFTDTRSETGAADINTATSPAPRFRVRSRRGVGTNGTAYTAYIVVAVDADRTSRISTRLMSSAQQATGAADLLNHANHAATTTAPGSDTVDQAVSEDARSLVLARIEQEFPPQIRLVTPLAEPLIWRAGVHPSRIAAADATNTYIVERHSASSWELCAWNSTTFDDVHRLAGTMTPTRELARTIAAEYSALGQQYPAEDHGGMSRATAAIVVAYNHERARYSAASVVQVSPA
jgi:hypothetical protein